MKDVRPTVSLNLDIKENTVLMIKTIALLCFANAQILTAKSTNEQKRLPEIKDHVQAVELVMGRGCLITVVPSEDFEVHVPLDSNSKPDYSKVYSSGHAMYHIENARSCAMVTITRTPVTVIAPK